jgi:hypothetical protein
MKYRYGLEMYITRGSVEEAVVRGLERSSPTRGEQYTIGLAVSLLDVLGRRYKEVGEALLLEDTGGNAEVSCPHLCPTSSEIL